MKDLIEGMGYLGVPVAIAVVFVGLFLIMQIIGEILEFKGKIVPEFLKIRKYFKRKKEEKEKQKRLLEKLAEKLESFEGHYSPDNIARRNEWMRGVDDRAVTCGMQMADITNTLMQVTQALQTNTKMTEDMFVESSRDRIISFAEKAADYDILLSREQFRRIDRVYQEYERFLEERGRQNGEVDIAYEAIQDGYRHRLQHHAFLEDIKGYKIK